MQALGTCGSKVGQGGTTRCVDLNAIWEGAWAEHREVLLATTALSESASAAGRQWIECLRGGGKVVFCGNGGSASDAMHLSAELTGRFVRERRSLPSVVLGSNPSALTAISNDYGYEAALARELSSIGNQGDVLVALSTSGNSPNILAAAHEARSRGMVVQAWTGEGGGKLAQACNLLLAVPSRTTARVQEMHILIGHVLCAAVDAEVL